MVDQRGNPTSARAVEPRTQNKWVSYHFANKTSHGDAIMFALPQYSVDAVPILIQNPSVNQ